MIFEIANTDVSDKDYNGEYRRGGIPQAKVSYAIGHDMLELKN
jgi:hypothetical protein